jgi:hypothetical protein
MPSMSRRASAPDFDNLLTNQVSAKTERSAPSLRFSFAVRREISA